MYHVKRADSSITKDYREILNMQAELYGELYQSDPNIKFELVNNSGVKIGVEERLLLESKITVDECYDAMMMLKANKSTSV